MATAHDLGYIAVGFLAGFLAGAGLILWRVFRNIGKE
jgi:hypothetical protein